VLEGGIEVANDDGALAFSPPADVDEF